MLPVHFYGRVEHTPEGVKWLDTQVSRPGLLREQAMAEQGDLRFVSLSLYGLHWEWVCCFPGGLQAKPGEVLFSSYTQFFYTLMRLCGAGVRLEADRKGEVMADVNPGGPGTGPM
jgi:hypothetical protein